jgi:hypothetical protein
MHRLMWTPQSWGFLAVLISTALLQPIAALADCPGDLQGTDGALGQQLDQDPAGTLPRLKAMLQQTAMHGGQDPSAARRRLLERR